MEGKKRFILHKTLSGVLSIKDTKDDSLVAIMMKCKRGPKKTEAMATVMIDALNNAVRKDN